MKKQSSFSGPAEYDQKRPYCVVYPAGPSVAYEIDSRYATRKAAERAAERGSMSAQVRTITQVKKANAEAKDTEANRLQSYE